MGGTGLATKAIASAPAAPAGIPPQGYAYRPQTGQPAEPGSVPNAADAAPSTVRNVGTKTFYRKDNRWIDSAVKPDDEAKAIVIEQFSEPFFQLARGQSAEFNQYLTFPEPVTVLIAGKVYRIEPPKPGK